MSVPNTNTFKLSDVVNEINPTLNSLVDCFAAADTRGFDPLYEGSKDRLSNFRNYGHPVWYSFHPSEFGNDCGHIWVTNSNWATARGAASGTLNLSNPYKVAALKSGPNYTIKRTFLKFDLGSISGKTCLSVELHIRQDAIVGASTIAILAGNQSTTLLASDYDSFAFNDYIISAAQSTYVHMGSTIRKVVATVGQRALIEADFGGYFMIAILEEEHDNSNSVPGDDTEYSFDFYKSGECISGEICRPELRIEYMD